MKEQNILIVDDHEVMRDGVITTLRQNKMGNNLYEAEDGGDALSKCNEHEEIDIVLLDINLPDMDGVDVIKKIETQFPDIEIIAFSMRNDEESIRTMLQAGASGYVLKSAGKADLIQAIKNISQGKPFYSQEVTFNMMKYHSDPESFKEVESSDLTNRELEILQLIVNEYTNQEIADKLYISKRTVDTHRTNLLQKTHSKNTAGLVRYALKNNVA